LALHESLDCIRKRLRISIVGSSTGQLRSNASARRGGPTGGAPGRRGPGERAIVLASSRPVGSCSAESFWDGSCSAGSCCGWSAIGFHLPAHHSEAPPGQQLWNVGADCGGDQDLLGDSYAGGQALPTYRIQLGEDVIEHEHRLYPIGAEQMKAAEPEGKG